MKVSEIVYSILDLSRTSSSDDSFFTEEHALFLAKKYRSLLLRKEQEKEKSTLDQSSEFEYQQICLDLEQVPAIDGSACTGGYYLRTTQEIPKLMEGSHPRVYPIDYYQGTYISYISRDRMRFTGSNPYLQHIIYVSLGPDHRLYLNSSNPQFLYLKQLRMCALFEDFDEAAELLCDDAGGDVSCDPMDMDFPIRDYLVPTLIELVVKELSGANIIRPDERNNANDDMSDENRRK